LIVAPSPEARHPIFDHRHFRGAFSSLALGVGNRPTAKAREMVERMRHKGDNEGANTWLRIIVAIRCTEVTSG